jgi:ABC-2 type transport system permease protein
MHIKTIFQRELRAYFTTPIAYVFIVIFLLLTGIFTFYLGDFFARGQADLMPFFSFHPWLYMIFLPAITMRLWAEERKNGTIELLFTLPITTGDIVVGKFLAAWFFTLISLILTLPIWLCVNYLGEPDNGVILASYLGSLLMAGGFLAIGACISALTKNQVIAFVLSVLACLLINLCGFPVVNDILKSWLPEILVDTINSFSFITNFDVITKGIIDVKSLCFFTSLIIFSLYTNSLLIDAKKAN